MRNRLHPYSWNTDTISTRSHEHHGCVRRRLRSSYRHFRVRVRNSGCRGITHTRVCKWSERRRSSVTAGRHRQMLGLMGLTYDGYPHGTKRACKLRDFAESFVSSVFRRFNDIENELAPPICDSRSTTNITAFTQPGLVKPSRTSVKLSAVNFPKPSMVTRPIPELRNSWAPPATISDWWNNKESAICFHQRPLANRWQFARSDFIEQTDEKPRSHGWPCCWRYAFAHDRIIIRSKGVAMGHRAGMTTSQAAPLSAR